MASATAWKPADVWTKHSRWTRINPLPSALGTSAITPVFWAYRKLFLTPGRID